MRWMIVLVLMVAAQAKADNWVYFENVKILSIIQWQDNSPVFVKMAANSYCYIPAGEKNLIALFYSLHATGKSVDVHCFHDQTLESGGFTGHRVHRVVTK